MTEDIPLKPKGRKAERLFLILTSIVIGLLFFSLHTVLNRDFEDVHQRLADGTMLNLNRGDAGVGIWSLLQKGYYF
jgi:hypothetical protein